MTRRRWPWLGSAGLLLAAAVVAAWSVYLHWLPCRGTMLVGTFWGYLYDREFSDACLRRMDGGMPFLYPPELGEQTAWAAELGVAAVALGALAWLALVVGLTCDLPTKMFAMVPGLVTLGLAGSTARLIERPDRSFEAPTSVGALVNLLTAAAVVVILLRTEKKNPWSIAALLALAWGSTALAGIHQMVEYLVMIHWSAANWDVPPGTGYLTAAGLGLAGALTLAYALRWPGPAERSEPTRAVLVDRPA